MYYRLNNFNYVIFNRNRQITSDDFFDFDDSIRSSKTCTPSKIDVIKNDWNNIKPAKKVNKDVENDSWDNYEYSNKKHSRNNRTKNITPQPLENNEAFKKFGGAKSISSTQYFGDNQTLVSYFYILYKRFI